MNKKNKSQLESFGEGWFVSGQSIKLGEMKITAQHCGILEDRENY